MLGSSVSRGCHGIFWGTFQGLRFCFKVPLCSKKLDDGWPESEKGKDVDVKYIEERRRCEKISEERMNI